MSAFDRPSLGPVGRSIEQARAALLLVFAYVVTRREVLFNLDSPIFGWRPADMASIALGFLRHGFNLFYPRIFWGGNGPGYVEMEFPIVPYLTAVLFKLFGFHEYLCLVIPQLCGLALVFLIYRFGAYLYNSATSGLVAGLLAAMLAPLMFLTDTGQYADLPTVVFAVLALYTLALWVDRGKQANLYIAIFAASFSILLKLTTLYIGIPFVYLFIKKYGRNWWKTRTTWVSAAAIALPPLVWYLHGYQLALEYHNSFGILSLGYSKLGSIALFTSPEWYIRTANKLFLYHFTPLGTLGVAAALVGAYYRRTKPLALWWLASVVLYAFVSARGVLEGHYHYLMPVLPIGAILAGGGLIWLLDRILNSRPLRGRAQLATAVTMLAAVLLLTNAAWSLQRFQARDRPFIGEAWAKKKRTGRLVGHLAVPGALLLVVDEEMDRVTPERSMTPPDVFYFSDHQGWYLSMAWLTNAGVEARRKAGARYFVVSGQAVDAFKRREPELYASLSRNYKKVFESDDGIMFDFKATP